MKGKGRGREKLWASDAFLDIQEARMHGESALCTGGAEGVAVALDGELGNRG